MSDRMEALAERPLWVLFAVVVVLVSLYQMVQGQYSSGAFGILVAVVLLLSILFQPGGPTG